MIKNALKRQDGQNSASMDTLLQSCEIIKALYGDKFPPILLLNSGHINFGCNQNYGGGQPYPLGNEKRDIFTDQNVRRAIDYLMLRNIKANKRWWFIPYRVLKDNDIIGCMSDYESYLMRLYNNRLPVPIDTHDLINEVDVYTHAKAFVKWDQKDSQFTAKTYNRYVDLITQFYGFLGIGSQDMDDIDL